MEIEGRLHVETYVLQGFLVDWRRHKGFKYESLKVHKREIF